ncbi:MAG TPA: hypothetical protein VFR81_14165 [Longimicrobium sp.]|nr:hypothetical protein [Longimicrobium sp.]
MASKKKPWRTIVLAGDTGRFTWEQLHAAVQKAVAREAKAAGKRRPDTMSEEGEEKPWRTIVTSRHKGRFTRKQAEDAVRTVKDKSERGAAKQDDRRNKEREMSAKKPYAPIIVGGGSGRFTPEQIEAAVRAVREKRERKAARQAKKAAGPRRGPTAAA